MPKLELQNCHDCGVAPGSIHKDGCDVERCSICGGQFIDCNCQGHDKQFAYWKGIHPGKAESIYLGVDINIIYSENYHKQIFVKPQMNISCNTCHWSSQNAFKQEVCYCQQSFMFGREFRNGEKANNFCKYHNRIMYKTT